jgi:hypothetical protein
MVENTTHVLKIYCLKHVNLILVACVTLLYLPTNRGSLEK